jgi:hypothetical protein
MIFVWRKAGEARNLKKLSRSFTHFAGPTPTRPLAVFLKCPCRLTLPEVTFGQMGLPRSKQKESTPSSKGCLKVPGCLRYTVKLIVSVGYLTMLGLSCQPNEDLPPHVSCAMGLQVEFSYIEHDLDRSSPAF